MSRRSRRRDLRLSRFWVFPVLAMIKFALASVESTSSEAVATSSLACLSLAAAFPGLAFVLFR